MSALSDEDVEGWLRSKHDALVQGLAEVLEVEAGLAEKIGCRLDGTSPSHANEIALYRTTEIAGV
ncbi:hypothetical protein NONI108955_28035 [Nocardia ninae]|uniref:Uncharacterized protein n=1 Tax=Nocardia ninae NBRC 108245 TaxID=1210091 RepID=A0A511MHP4_9NOCA|nr:hypothetical protein [Nocardia ninae]GEM40079.1 hypothetical protein NN4_45980 [Nocardia ninae NBRC 108245]